MKSLVPDECECAVCGHNNEIGDPNPYGYLDLDFRPPAIVGASMPTWVTECTSCGYSAPDLDTAYDGVEAIVTGDAFRDIRSNSENLTEVARKFHLAAFIAAEIGDTASAFHHTLCEAWVHDDENNTLRAHAARLKAIDLLEQFVSENDFLSDEPGADWALTVDLLRRTGQFERAIHMCREGLAEPGNVGFFGALHLQLELSEKGDTGRHTMGEIRHEKESN